MTLTIDTTRNRRLPLYALLVANTISLVGSQLTMIALPWFVLQTTGSAALTGLAGVAVFLPGFLAGIFGGTVIDRLGYRRVSVAADLVSGAAIALVPLLYDVGALPFALLLALIFVGNLLEIPGLTARRSLLPELATLGGIKLERVNTAFESVRSFSYLAGPPLAAALIATIGSNHVLWLDAASFLISATIIGALVPALKVAAQPTAHSRYRDELAAGLRFIKNDRLLLTLALNLTFANMFTNTLAAVVLPVYAQQVYGNVAVLGALGVAFGAGALLGGVFFGAVGHHRARRTLWIIGFLGGALPFWAMSIAPPLWALVAAFGLMALMGGPLDPILITVRHERIPPELRGRVFSTFSALAMGAVPLGILLAGYGIERLGLTPTLLVMAVSLQLLGLTLPFLPILKEMDIGRTMTR